MSRKGKVILSIVAVFLLGAATGGSVALVVAEARLERALGQGSLRTRMFTFALDRKLDLTDAQRERVSRIVDEGQRERQRIEAQLEPELAVARRRVASQIRQVLTDEQRKTFDEVIRRRHQEGRPGDR